MWSNRKKDHQYEHNESAGTRWDLIQNQPSRLASPPTTYLPQTGQDKIMHLTVDIKEIIIYVPLPLYPSYHSSVVWPSLDPTNEGSLLIWRSEVILIESSAVF